MKTKSTNTPKRTDTYILIDALRAISGWIGEKEVCIHAGDPYSVLIQAASRLEELDDELSHVKNELHKTLQP